MNFLDNVLSNANSFLTSPIGKAAQNALLPPPKAPKVAAVPAATPANVPESKMSQGVMIGIAAAVVAMVGLLVYLARGR